MNKIIKLGFVLSRMSPSQVCFDMIEGSNRYLAESDDVDICGFWVEDGPKPAIPRFSCMPIIECFAFPGHTIATSLHALSRVLSYPGPNRAKHIYFYDYNLDYTKIPAQARSWEQLNLLYNHPKVQLIARSKEHGEILSSTFRSPLAIIEDFNIGKFKELVQ